MSQSITVRFREDAVPLVAALSTRTDPGVDVLLAFDDQGHLTMAIPLEPGTSLPAVVGLIAGIALPGEQLMLVSNRSGQDCADQWDDELVWEEMVGTARANDIVMLDWWVTVGTKAFSLAEFAPTPAAWVT